MAPMAGDEINILGAGRNYGWSLVGLGHSYEGPYTAGSRIVMEWIARLRISSPASRLRVWPYTGKDFPSWTSCAFAGAQRLGMFALTGRFVRIQFDDQYNERAREELLVDVRQCKQIQFARSSCPS